MFRNLWGGVLAHVATITGYDIAMSDALNFLLKARPDALGHYFAFIKDCGSHLDPKTKALISVITKVDAQTERGLRQYLQRALQVGCTPMEVLDALLMAFPTLGLTKIIWAVDIILALQLPGFARLAQGAAAAAPDAPDAALDTAAKAAAPATPTWHDLLATQALAVGQARHLALGARGVWVYRRSQRGWRVNDDRCPHQGTRLTAPGLQAHSVICPLHGWAFDVRSGACTANGDRPLTELSCRVIKGRLQALW